EIQVTVTGTPRSPNERRAFLQESQVVVQLDPAGAGFGQQDARSAVARIDFQQVQPLLVARLPLNGEVLRVRKPRDSCEVCFRSAEIDRNDAVRRELQYLQLHLGI